jgi:hypothetical protein
MRTLVRPAALIESWFDLLPEPSRLLARELQVAVLAAAPTLVQAIKWGNLVFMHRGVNALAIVAHRHHLNLQFFNGQRMAQQYTQLEGSGKGMRHLKLRPGAVVDAELLAAMVQASLDELDVPD